MSTPVDPALARMQQSMTAAHALALDAVLTARTTGIRDGINAAADMVDAATRTPDIPELFATQLCGIRDAIRLLAYQINDPEPVSINQDGGQ